MTSGPLCILFLAAATAGAPGEAASQQAPDEEIIVTGERVPRALRETPSSVVVLGGDAIEASAADRLEQLLALVPNVQFGSGEEGVAIRGQDSTGLLRNLFAFLGGTRPRVTLQVDGRPVTYYEFVSGSESAWDVERVEVFRSPQTTTQGRNSIAGAIFVETNDPGYSWEGRGRVIVGDFRTRQASAFVSGPLVRDQLAVRLSGDLRLSRMASDMADAIAGANIDRDDYGTGRAKLLYEPAALPGLRIETSYVHTQTQSPQFEGAMAPFRARRLPVPNQTNGVHKINVDSITARAGYEIGPALNSTLTLSYGDALIRRFGLPGLGLTRVDSTDYSAEANLSWRPGGALSLLGGVHSLATRQRQSIDITGLGIGTGGFRDRQGSLGLFGEATWRPTSALALTGGLRYQRDRQERVGAVGSILLDYDETFDAWLPKVSVAWDVTDAVTAGLLVQRAFNPGGTSISLLRRAEDSFGAERLWNYEAFVRGSLAGGRRTFAMNVFYNDITDAQRQQTVPVTLPNGTTLFAAEFANAPEAESYGAEAEFGWRLRNRLTVRAAIGFLETEVHRTALARDPTLKKTFQRSPGVSAAGAVDWRPIDPLRLSATVRHQSGYFSDDANTQARRIGASTIVDARAAYTFGPVTVFGYARNLFDDFYLTYLFTPTFGTPGDPREFGVGVEARF